MRVVYGVGLALSLEDGGLSQSFESPLWALAVQPQILGVETDIKDQSALVWSCLHP